MLTIVNDPLAYTKLLRKQYVPTESTVIVLSAILLLCIVIYTVSKLRGPS